MRGVARRWRSWALRRLAAATGAAPRAPPSPEALAANDPYEADQPRRFWTSTARSTAISSCPPWRSISCWCRKPGAAASTISWAICRLPTTFVNDVLQGELSRGGQTAGRFTDQHHLRVRRLFRSRQPTWAFPIMARISARPWRSGAWAKGPIWCCPFWAHPIRATPSGQVADIGLDPTNLYPFQAAYLVVGGARIFHPAGPARPDLSDRSGHPAQFGGLLCLACAACTASCATMRSAMAGRPSRRICLISEPAFMLAISPP